MKVLALPAVTRTHQTKIKSGAITLKGDLTIPKGAERVVVFAHGFGSSRQRPRSHRVAEAVQDAGIGVLVLDLLTAEEASEMYPRQRRFDIGFFAERLVNATFWLKSEFDHQRVGYFGASTEAAAALVAAAALGEIVGAVVSRSGRPDLAADSLPMVKAPTLLIVGGLDHALIEMNRQAYGRLRCEKQIELVAHATHLFEDSKALDHVAHLAAGWFQTHLTGQRPSAEGIESGFAETNPSAPSES